MSYRRYYRVRYRHGGVSAGTIAIRQKGQAVEFLTYGARWYAYTRSGRIMRRLGHDFGHSGGGGPPEINGRLDERTTLSKTYN